MLVNQAMEDILIEMVTALLASKIKTDLQWSVFCGVEYLFILVVKLNASIDSIFGASSSH